MTEMLQSGRRFFDVKIKSVIVYPHLGIKEEIEEEVNESVPKKGAFDLQGDSDENKDIERPRDNNR